MHCKWIQFIYLYDHSGVNTVKILARNHQYLGVNEAIKAYEARKLNDGKLGVFWHTQGSVKSYSMVFLAQKIRRKFAGSPTIVDHVLIVKRSICEIMRKRDCAYCFLYSLLLHIVFKEKKGLANGDYSFSTRKKTH